MIQLDFVPRPKLIVQIYGRVEQLIVVLILDESSIQNFIYLGRVTDKSTGVQVSFASRYRRIMNRQGFIRPAIRLRRKQDSSASIQESFDDGGQTTEKYNVVTKSRKYTRYKMSSLQCQDIPTYR